MIEAIAVFYRNQDGYEPPKVLKIALGERGESVRDSGVIHRRAFAVGIGQQEGLVLTYPKGSERLQGDHADPEAFICSSFGNRGLVAVLHGSIHPERRADDTTTHIVSIYKINPDDITILGGSGIVEEITALKPWERGRLYPERFITENIAQRLLHALDATRLQIVYAMASRTIYGLTRNGNRANYSVQTVTNYQREGD